LYNLSKMDTYLYVRSLSELSQPGAPRRARIQTAVMCIGTASLGQTWFDRGWRIDFWTWWRCVTAEDGANVTITVLDGRL
jgi:hypothetical protein